MPVRARWGEALTWVRAVAEQETDECQLWPFAAMAGEVPRPVIGSKGKLKPVTHVVLELAGRSLQDGQQANHTCDEPLCCNPRHLYGGTQYDNIRDAIRRGRMDRLQEDVIAEIRQLSLTMGYKQIAKTLGVTFDAARYHARKARREAI